MPKSIDEIPLEQRQLIFKTLVEAQDGGMAVAASRRQIAQQFSITEEQVKAIEREGSDAQWPPLV
ncbi:MAG: hypothetical protein RMJ56_10055 [Gemmataceae bacterium]|nr:hypothetical protein [Gemmata sp.]MDW8197933.1 hypothetical protein [Gemmataceae bacterium]